MLELLRNHRDGDLVAFGADGERDRAALERDATLLAAKLPDPTPDSHVLLVFKRDRYAFAAALLAALHRGHRVALPPNTRREAVMMVLERDECVAMMHDTDAGAPIRVQDLLGGPIADVGAPVRAAFADDEHIATVFTSGSTGAMRPWSKTAGQLLGEAAMLVDRFGLGADARVAATVPPGHIYGLLFSMLVPLMGGGAFLRESPFHAETVADAVRTHAPTTLVTVPAHLRALSRLAPTALAPLERVVSSTAPLDADTAAAFEKAHGVPVVEVFGSSETGGIATRRRAEGAAWSPLPRVEVSIDGDAHLCVRSPFVDPELPQPYRTADLAQATAAGGFIHEGRSDGVVKVGGRRVSLPAMRAQLMSEPAVEDAEVVAVASPGARGTRILAAVVAPGWTMDDVRGALADRFEASCLPRRCVFVDALPREENGKLQRGRLLRLFDLAPDGAPLRWDLDWGSEDTRVEDGVSTARFAVDVPPTYVHYDGHFPGYPIMAGAVQLLELVAPSLRRARPDLGRVERFTRLKFLDRILPGDGISVELSWRDEEPTVDFRLLRGDTTCSAGRAALATLPSSEISA